MSRGCATRSADKTHAPQTFEKSNTYIRLFFDFTSHAGRIQQVIIMFICIRKNMVKRMTDERGICVCVYARVHRCMYILTRRRGRVMRSPHIYYIYTHTHNTHTIGWRNHVFHPEGKPLPRMNNINRRSRGVIENKWNK